MASRDGMLSVLVGNCDREEDAIIIDGVKYIAGELFKGNKLPISEYEFAVTYSDDRLRTIIYYNNDEFTSVYFNRLAGEKKYHSELKKYIKLIPGTYEGLRIGDPLIISDVKRVINVYNQQKMILDEVVEASITRPAYCREEQSSNN